MIAVTIVICITLLFLLVILWKWKFLWICLKTSKRDLRGALGFIRMQLGLRSAKKRNLTVNKKFDQIAIKFPNRICCYFEEEEWTFGAMQDLTNRVANYFLTQNFQRGDPIAVFMENRPEYIALWLGLAKVGLVPALINTNLRLSALEHCIKVANSKAIIFGFELAQAVTELKISKMGVETLYQFGKGGIAEGCSVVDLSEMLDSASANPVTMSPDIGYNDKLFYIYTSGTTGLPKAAVIKHSRYILVALGSRSIHNIDIDDVVYTALPLYHSAATILAFGHSLLYGSSVVFRKKFSASNFWKDCIKYNVTAIQYIGEICRYLLAQPPKPEDTKHKVRLMFGNGFRSEIWRQFVTRFNIPNVREFYGSTEGNCNLGSCDSKVGSVGFIPVWAKALGVLPVVLVKIDDQSGEPLRDPSTGLAIKAQIGEPGELMGIIKTGDPISEFQGYTDEGSQKKKVVRDICRMGDVAFRSGDILVSDDLGYFYFKDRQGDTFRWKGENVSTAEVEAVLSRSSVGLAESAVYGVEIPGSDGRAGMASILDPEETVDLVALATDIKNNLPTYARPLFIRLLKQIDVTGTYKIKKTELQREGFDIRNISDPIFYLAKGTQYEPLESSVFEGIMSGTVRL